MDDQDFNQLTLFDNQLPLSAAVSAITTTESFAAVESEAIATYRFLSSFWRYSLTLSLRSGNALFW